MTRFLLIGLDGAAPNLIEPWMADGVLPHLAGLQARGCYARCASTMPPATFPAWTTCVTGVNPGRHGLFDFTEMVSEQYAVRFVNATFRKAPALWTILSAAGKRVGVLGVPATYPPEPVNGIMVSGFDSPVCTRIDASFVYPRRLYPRVRAWRFADLDESNIGPGWHERALPRLIEGIRIKEGIARRLLEDDPSDLFMVVFGEADTAAHHFWLFHDLNSPRHRPGCREALRDVYVRLDEAVGALIAAAGPDATVAVVSDHGFGGAGTGVVHLNNWLAGQGFLRFADRPTVAGPIKQALLRWTPNAWRGALFSRFRRLAARTESAARFSGMDWGQTRAWSEELNYFPSVRVNLEGREPEGQVARAEYDAFCTELCRQLETWPVVKKAWRRDELYSGDYVDRAPDIILELALENGYSYSCLRSRDGPAFRRITEEERFGGRERGMTGNHRSPGVLFLSKPAHVAAPRLEDVAPTVLAELGVAGPFMEGRSLFGGAVELAEPPPVADERPYRPAEEQVIEDRLRGLGYFK